MGIIRAAINAVTGGLADTWLEVIEPSPMGNNDVIVPGQAVDQRGRSQNKKGGENLVSNGSIIHVYDNQFMILVDGGKIVDYTATPGYYKVDNSALPSLFNGQFGDAIKESFSRIKYGGISSTSQRVFFMNLAEIKNIKFGTQSPVQYFDNFYESELFMRLHGTYSINPQRVHHPEPQVHLCSPRYPAVQRRVRRRAEHRVQQLFRRRLPYQPHHLQDQRDGQVHGSGA